MVPFYEFQPSDINIIHNTRELKYRSHIHKQIELIYVFKLGQHINIDGIDYEIRKGEAAVIFPNTVHTYYRKEQRGTDQVFIIASTELFDSVLPDLENFSAENPIITDIDAITVTAFKEITACTDPAEKLAWTLLIMSKLLKKLKLLHKDSVPVRNLTQKIITYIGQNFRENITLDSLAKEFSVSKFYISHTFSEKIKISLPNYLALIRAEYAAGLIRTTNDSITNICNSSGFSSQSTFNRAFKRIYCMTPREYKDNIGELYKTSG
ncbi:MAG: helix-turn-helix domain-containing protein [Candidatus Ornithomonoglobus sp.]